MYFNRKNAEQKNWRMIKKGKHFLFGCSLVFAVGAALVAPSVKADTVGAKPVAAKENVTYVAPAVEVAPAAVAEEKVEKTVETTQNSKEEAVEATEKAKEAVETTEKAKEADSIQAPEVTVVYNPAALTDEEKAKVVAAVKAANPTATDVQVQADGSAVVTFADGSRANLTAAQTIKDGSQVAKRRRARATVAAPVITSNLDGKGSSATDVTVQAPAGSTVKLYNTDGVVIGQAVANAQGVATVTPTNSLPVGEITATATPAGESESPKSAPVTATRPTLTTVEGGVSRGNDSYNTQLLVTKSHITVYPGESVKVGVTAVSNGLENFSVPNNPAGVKGLLPRGTFLKSGGTGSETVTRRDNGYGGTVAWDQPAGDTVVTFSATSQNNVRVTRDLRVTVLELTKKLDAVPGEKVEVADLNNVSEDEKNKIIAATKKANASFPPGTVYNVDQRGNLVITYPDKSTDKIDASYLVTPSNKPAVPNKPAGQAPEITSDLSGKASTPTDVTVKAEPGSTVKLYNNDGVVIGEAVANDQGIATISPINSLPEGQITATATPAGGSESPKSTPITATRAEKPEVGGGVSRGGDNTQLLVTKSHITVYPGETVNIGVTAVSNELAKFWVPGNPVSVKGLKPTGTFLSKPGSPAVTRRDNGYGGTVAWDQPAGDTVVTFEAQSREHNVIVRRDLRVTVLELTKKLDAVAGEKVEVDDPNNVSEDEKNKIIEATKKANTSFPPGTTYSVDEKGNLIITYPDGSTDKIAAAYLVTPAPKDADKYTPTAKAQTVAPGSTPEAKNSIGNVSDLPSGTTFAYKTPVDTATKGEKDAIVVVTYPDKSTDEVPVKVTVKDPRSDADKNDPKAKAQDIYKGSTPDAKGSIDNADELPYGTSFAYKKPVDTTTPGEKDATVVVTYPDGSKDEVPVKVTVEDPDKISDAEKNTPTAKDQTVKVGEKPKAEASIGNFDKLPKGTTVKFKKPVDTKTPGEKDAIVVVTYPDTLTYEVPVKVTVKDPRSDADKNDPTAKAQTVAPGSTPEAKNSIGNVSDLPSGTTFAFKTPVDTATEGEKDATVVVTYPDGTTDEVPVKVTVKDPRSDADKNDPTAKAQTVAPGSTPEAKNSIGNVS
ncbi:Rib/alpha-like domain-containing protein, partial [Streptococcus oralis]|uniref:Rib/alpha-like domain-containing protein n=1 Tax=Streptococcus oralis TaxID=1303 RepID=UPI0024943577